jgi:hypothetical protein
MEGGAQPTFIDGRVAQIEKCDSKPAQPSASPLVFKLAPHAGEPSIVHVGVQQLDGARMKGNWTATSSTPRSRAIFASRPAEAVNDESAWLGPALTPQLNFSGPPLQSGGSFVWLWSIDDGMEVGFQVEAFPALFELAAQTWLPTVVRPSFQGPEERRTSTVLQVHDPALCRSTNACHASKVLTGQWR